jgi:hypothetical protein
MREVATVHSSRQWRMAGRSLTEGLGTKAPQPKGCATPRGGLEFYPGKALDFAEQPSGCVILGVGRAGNRDSSSEESPVLRRLGVTVRKTIDAAIATRCIESRYDLLHNDRDFDPFAKHLGLRVVVA